MWRPIAYLNRVGRTSLVVFIILGLILYLGPSLFRWFSERKVRDEDEVERCVSSHLLWFFSEAENFDAHIQHFPKKEGEVEFLPYVGNGIFAVSTVSDSPLYIRNGRTLSLPVNFHPVITFLSFGEDSQTATVTNYLTGISHKFQCFHGGLHASYQYFAHRTLPSVLVQEVKVENPSSEIYYLQLQPPHLSAWPTAISHVINSKNGQEYQIITGMVEVPNSSKVVAVSVATTKILKSLEVKARSSTTLEILTTVNYSEPISKMEYAKHKDEVERQAIDDIMKISGKSRISLRQDHVNVWQQLWKTGISISTSKAMGAVNGDKINATIYYVLSQVPSPYYEESTSKEKKNELAQSLFYADGCYSDHHTLQANNLWRDLRTVEEINVMVTYWMVTLEKQGCHNLLKAGASGVIEAMVLSFGGFRFSNQHLEMNIHPKYLHRDYIFRRISYGNMTHVNISIVLKEDNKAVLYVALDRSDKFYYACDGGCLDDPVQLGPERKLFPVKLTDPLTAILYITYDKKHMEDLRHAIHVKEIIEAPAHEHHVIALHKHGHQLGGLPTLFWVSICFLIIIFHLFLFKLIYNEYCGQQVKYRTRYGKF